MANLLEGMDRLGFGYLKNADLFEEEHKQEKEETSANADNKEPEIVMETDFILDKSFVCPVCGAKFTSKIVKAGKAKLIGSDDDLRPKYAGIDTVKYDAIMCEECGYAALSKYFTNLTPPQIKLIRENVCSQYKKISYTNDIYTYDEAIERLQMSLVNAMAKRAKASEKAYICLKMAWVYRGKAENLPKNASKYEQYLADTKAAEMSAIKNAYEGFLVSIEKELPPICGMDDSTITYLLADLAIKCNDMDNAKRFISRILLSRTANERIKNRARDLKELIRQTP
ncbi:MAG: DUF2225 domain-containing protein [Lachnospiraceae bacterium]|nr:DUF2225 domain-containing protein [Lachnospiraceae bacterium]